MGAPVEQLPRWITAAIRAEAGNGRQRAIDRSAEWGLHRSQAETARQGRGRVRFKWIGVAPHRRNGA